MAATAGLCANIVSDTFSRSREALPRYQRDNTQLLPHTLLRLTDDNVIMVQMTSDVVRLVVGLSITTVEWDSDGGLTKNFKVMAIMVPQIRNDQDGNSGVVHAS